MSISYEVFSNILKYCTHKKLKQVSLLSKEVYDLVNTILIYKCVRHHDDAELMFYDTTVVSSVYRHKKLMFRKTSGQKKSQIDNCFNYEISYINCDPKEILIFPHLDQIRILDLRGYNERFASSDEISLYYDSLSKKLSHLCQLYLYNCRLPQFPESICQLKQLTKLCINTADFRSIPESIGNLSQLQHLDLNRNDLESLPESIGNLKQLRILYLDFNRLTLLPESIGQLTHLRELDLYNNRLTHLPDCIHQLKYLRELDVRRNKFTNHLPNYLLELIESSKMSKTDFIPKLYKRIHDRNK